MRAHIMILATNKPEFCQWLCYFVMEVRQQDGAEYPPNSLRQLCFGILRYAREREPELDIFRDPAFLPFQKTLESGRAWEAKSCERDHTIALYSKYITVPKLYKDKFLRRLCDLSLFIWPVYEYV